VPSFTTERRVRHSASEMFDLVADVERYPRFVPMCDRLSIRSRETDGDEEILIATMTVSYRFLHESFTSRVTLDRKAMTIRAQYLDGPFRHLDNLWTFEALGPNESKVRFKIDYEFRSRTLGALMGAVFDRAFRRFAEAFETRADEVYGAPAAPA
jgi:coenzyme Q-binding protein COQ10